jgi:hypothetical protein
MHNQGDTMTLNTVNTEIKSEEGTTLEMIEDNTIGLMTLYGVARSTVDEWFDANVKLLTTWPKDKPYLVIHDASDRRTTVTPYMRARVNDLYKMNLRKDGFAAVVLPKSVTSQVIQVFLRYLRTEPMVVQVFFTRDEAIAWLKRCASRLSY